MATVFCAAIFCADASAQVQKRSGGEKDDNANTLQVFPNPTTGKFNISVKEQEKAFHVNIYNLVGEMIFHWESGNSTTANFEADLSRKPDGVYFVELDTEKANVLKRIIVDRAN
jgi:hypothetical protein